MRAGFNLPTLADRIDALPEPYRSNLIDWFRCGIDWPVHAPCDGLVNLVDLLRAAPLSFIVQLSQVLRETERYFGDSSAPESVRAVTNWPLAQTVFATSS
jgi:hypothetical protein